MAKLQALNNLSLVDFAVAAGLEEFEINGDRIFGEDQDKYFIRQDQPGVIEVVERNTEQGKGYQNYVKFSIKIQENPTHTWTS